MSFIFADKKEQSVHLQDNIGIIIKKAYIYAAVVQHRYLVLTANMIQVRDGQVFIKRLISKLLPSIEI